MIKDILLFYGSYLELPLHLLMFINIISLDFRLLSSSGFKLLIWSSKGKFRVYKKVATTIGDILTRFFLNTFGTLTL